ncbi:hypothetical protein HYZ64_01890 [Candidatus Berkelbacteria bacterium]|nr:hypothetical protein [Candidatus Berkelbacteria bacterium]
MSYDPVVQKKTDSNQVLRAPGLELSNPESPDELPPLNQARIIELIRQLPCELSNGKLIGRLSIAWQSRRKVLVHLEIELAHPVCRALVNQDQATQKALAIQLYNRIYLEQLTEPLQPNEWTDQFPPAIDQAVTQVETWQQFLDNHPHLIGDKIMAVDDGLSVDVLPNLADLAGYRKLMNLRWNGVHWLFNELQLKLWLPFGELNQTQANELGVLSEFTTFRNWQVDRDQQAIAAANEIEARRSAEPNQEVLNQIRTALTG